MADPRKSASSIKFQDVAVEVTSFFFVLSHNLIDLTNVNFYLQKSCRINATIEPDLTTKCDDETAGEMFTTKVTRTYRFGIYIISLLLVILISAWSDKAGKNRKTVLVYIICGQWWQLISSCIQSYFWYLPGILGVVSEFIGQTIFLGNIGFRIFAAMCICDITNQENRTSRLTLLSLVDMICLPISSGSSGFLMRRYGFLATYSICLLLTCATLISALFIKDVSEEPKIERIIPRLLSIFKLEHIRDSFAIVFKNKTSRQRCTLSVLFIVTIMVYFPLNGENSILYLYLRKRFDWNEEIYGYFLGYKLIAASFGIVFCSLVLSKTLKIHDGIIGMIAGLWDTIAVIAYFYAYESWQIYWIPILDIFHGVALIICHSFASKFFKSDEIGQFHSVFLLFAVTVCFGPMTYSYVFEKTMDSAPNTVFLLSIPLDILVCILYGVCYYLSKLQ